jgi:glycoside/pentoside/hexuronide:cation symporter, GPH family
MALLTSGAVLNLVGFDVDATSQTVETLTKLRLADIIIPIFFGGIAIWIMMKYDVTEERANEIRAALVARRGKVHHE